MLMGVPEQAHLQTHWTSTQHHHILTHIVQHPTCCSACTGGSKLPCDTKESTTMQSRQGRAPWVCLQGHAGQVLLRVAGLRRVALLRQRKENDSPTPP